MPISADWVTLCFIRYKRTNEVRVQIPPKSYFRFSGIHLHTSAKPFAKPLEESVHFLSILYLNYICLEASLSCNGYPWYGVCGGTLSRTRPSRYMSSATPRLLCTPICAPPRRLHPQGLLCCQAGCVSRKPSSSTRLFYVKHNTTRSWNLGKMIPVRCGRQGWAGQCSVSLLPMPNPIHLPATDDKQQQCLR